MIAIVDSGSGNLRSVEKALAHVGGAPVLTSDPDRIRRADRVVVPGQGAFGQMMAAIEERGLDQALREVIAAGRPYLGLCLGLQVLFDDSEEQGPVAGLGFIRGKVVRFRPREPRYKVPHMGWNQVTRVHADEPLLRGIPAEAYFYFVHSFYVVPDDPAVVALTCSYDVPFAAAVRKDNLFACQFHPEKSQAVGLKLLQNFAEAT
jgi:glutamine amidotransferase